jgi:hypothetical protein
MYQKNYPVSSYQFNMWWSASNHIIHTIYIWYSPTIQVSQRRRRKTGPKVFKKNLTAWLSDSPFLFCLKLLTAKTWYGNSNLLPKLGAKFDTSELWTVTEGGSRLEKIRFRTYQLQLSVQSLPAIIPICCRLFRVSWTKGHLLMQQFVQTSPQNNNDLVWQAIR